MTLARLLPVLALAVLGLTTPAVAGSYHGVSRPGLPLDPELLPANSGPGDCVVRRMTGPGGAYRWERIECEGQQSWSGRDQWGYGRHRLEVETRDGRPELLGGCDCDRRAYGGYGYGDRYGDYRQRQSLYDRRVDGYGYGRSSAYDSGYAGGYGDGGYVQGGYVSGEGGYARDRYAYGDGYGYGDGYAYGGRREDRYGPSPAYVDYGYDRAAGRDEDGYLVWPGKLP